MVQGKLSILSVEQSADYEELGFIQSIPILSETEVQHYRAEIEKTCRAIGGQVTRINASHLFFRWAWELSTHRRVLDCMEQLLGPNILLKSTRLFYKYGQSDSFVGWHQDGITERLEDARVPGVWIGITAATVENGCLRVVPRSHRLGLVPHAFRPHVDNLTTAGITAQAEIDSPHDIVMRPGEMSLHHPLVLHASNPNRSTEPRIGFTATYSTPALTSSRTPVAWVRGNGPRHCFEVIDEPPHLSLEDAVAAYRAYEDKVRSANQQPGIM
ncbi:MAG TPA: phytanoyl-CoA dioxygenase family protein [Pyrinomonadaceae bacterium]|jgi:ectoine hydroxylase-related dioxygenase (phytanoyl-CoA dioxygenase family)|nr:phytanoyl-CoA dioxygenase family protein [Pyrinomonadaceae bacterium]